MTHSKNAENMNILAFDTTLDKTYIALQKGTPAEHKTLAECVIKTDEKNYHSAYLISAIKEILEKNDLKLQELDLIAVNNGPGSFTGIRVGVTVAKTLSKELGVNVLGVSSLDILQKAYEACPCSVCDNKTPEIPSQGVNPAKPDVIMDARKEMFYVKDGEDIVLVPYSDIQNHITQNTVVCDASSFPKLKSALESHPEMNLINFEEKETNLALALLNIAKETLQNLGNTDAPANEGVKTPSNTDLSWHTLNPRYIQPPPIHKK